MKDFILMILPLCFLCFPILGTIAANRLLFLYEDFSKEKEAFNLIERTWGPTRKDAKKVYRLSTDNLIKLKCRQAIRLYNFSYLSLFIFFILYFIQLLI